MRVLHNLRTVQAVRSGRRQIADILTTGLVQNLESKAIDAISPKRQ